MTIYAKSVGMVVATIVAAIVAAMTGDNQISNVEWVNVFILGAGAASVFTAPNVPGAKYTKTILAVITAVLTAAASYITGGFTTTELLQLALAAGGAVGVLALPKSGAY